MNRPGETTEQLEAKLRGALMRAVDAQLKMRPKLSEAQALVIGHAILHEPTAIARMFAEARDAPSDELLEQAARCRAVALLNMIGGPLPLEGWN